MDRGRAPNGIGHLIILVTIMTTRATFLSTLARELKNSLTWLTNCVQFSTAVATQYVSMRIQETYVLLYHQINRISPNVQ